MDSYCKPRETKLYQLVTIVDQSKIKNMYIHKGKDPSLDLMCFGPDQKHCITVMFPGDFERQNFVGNMMDCYKTGGAEKEEEGGGAQGGEEDDSDSDEAGAQTESDEDGVDGEIYD